MKKQNKNSKELKRNKEENFTDLENLKKIDNSFKKLLDNFDLLLSEIPDPEGELDELKESQKEIRKKLREIFDDETNR